jgi:hypothetical protein
MAMKQIFHAGDMKQDVGVLLYMCALNHFNLQLVHYLSALVRNLVKLFSCGDTSGKLLN